MILNELQLKFIKVVSRNKKFLEHHLEDKHLRVISKIVDSNSDVINERINAYDRIMLGEVRSAYIKYLKLNK